MHDDRNFEIGNSMVTHTAVKSVRLFIQIVLSPCLEKVNLPNAVCKPEVLRKLLLQQTGAGHLQ